MQEAQVIAKTWKRRMRGQISNEDQMRDYDNFNRNYGEVYQMIQEEAHDAGSDDEQEERAAGQRKEKKGFFGKMGDKISAGLFKATKMNNRAFNKK